MMIKKLLSVVLVVGLLTQSGMAWTMAYGIDNGSHFRDIYDEEYSEYDEYEWEDDDLRFDDEEDLWEDASVENDSTEEYYEIDTSLGLSGEVGDIYADISGMQSINSNEIISKALNTDIDDATEYELFLAQFLLNRASMQWMQEAFLGVYLNDIQCKVEEIFENLYSEELSDTENEVLNALLDASQGDDDTCEELQMAVDAIRNNPDAELEDINALLDAVDENSCLCVEEEFMYQLLYIRTHLAVNSNDERFQPVTDDPECPLMTERTIQTLLGMEAETESIFNLEMLAEVLENLYCFLEENPVAMYDLWLESDLDLDNVGESLAHALYRTFSCSSEFEFDDGEDILNLFANLQDETLPVLFLQRLNCMECLYNNVEDLEWAEQIEAAATRYAQCYVAIQMDSCGYDVAPYAAQFVRLACQLHLLTSYDKDSISDYEEEQICLLVAEGDVCLDIRDSEGKNVANLSWNDESYIETGYEMWIHMVKSQERSFLIAAIPNHYDVRIYLQEETPAYIVSAWITDEELELIDTFEGVADADEEGYLDAETYEIMWRPLEESPEECEEHIFGDPSFFWSEDNTCTAVFTCEKCAAVQDEECTVEMKLKEGYVVYIATVNLNGQKYADELQEATAHVHSYYAPAFEWNKDYSKCTALFSCKLGDDTQKIPCDISVSSGSMSVTYTASVLFAGEKYTGIQTIRESTAAGHDYGEPEFDWSSDYHNCVATFVCKDDDDKRRVPCTIISEQNDDNQTVEYTAEVTLGGQTFEDTRVVDKPVSKHIHKYAVAYKWAKDFSSCTAVFQCMDGDDRIELPCEVTSEENLSTKKNVYTAEISFEGCLYISIKEEDLVSSHVYMVTFEWNEDYSRCQAMYECLECDENGAKECVVSLMGEKGAEYRLAQVVIDGQTFEATHSIEGKAHKKKIIAALLISIGILLLAMAVILLLMMRPDLWNKLKTQLLTKLHK